MTEKELALRLEAVCADARRKHDLRWDEVFRALSLAMLSVMRSCDCADCRKSVFRRVKRLPKHLAEARAYAVEKYAGRVGHC
jgi:hypothetical protein